MSKTRILALAAVTLSCLTTNVISQQPMQAIKVFASVDINGSIKSGASSYGTNTINVSCPSGVIAKISSTPDGTGNLLEDNLLYLENLTAPTLTPPDGGDGGINGGLNICRQGDTNFPGNSTATMCFQPPYENAASGFTGQDPDAIGGSFLNTYGVPPLDISGYLWPGATQKLKFDLIDYGGLLGTSTLYLVTTCSQNGVVSGGSLTGNPITPNDPQSLTQNLPFDSTNNQLVQFIADFALANNAETLTIPPGTVPFVQDNFVTQNDYKTMVAGTSLAPSDCIPLNGELDSNGNPACKFFTMTCINSASSTASGTNCPQSTARNSVFRSKYDANPAFIQALQPGTGFGFLMGSDNWIVPTANCLFPTNSSEAGLLCPQNIETEFLGDFASGGGTKGLNSTFIAVRNVPLPSTTVTVTPSTSYGWTNSSTPSVTFVSNPATYSGNSPNGFIPAPIASVTYGVLDSVPDTALPVAGDSKLTNSAPCPAAPTSGASAFTPPPVTLGPLADGSHSLHYFATDCAATEELRYTVQPANLGNWASFKVQAINVDTLPPTAAFNSQPPANNILVLHGPAANVPFNCADSGSGLAVCGSSSGQQLASPGVPIYSGSITIPTNVLGTTNVAIYAKDLAGNTTNSSTVSYTVQYAMTGNCLKEPNHQILWPINADGTSVFQRGLILPARFRVCDANGASIGTAGTIRSVSVQTVGGGTQTFGRSPFFWDPLLKEWDYLIPSSTLAARHTYIYTVTLNDNSSIIFQFSLR